MSMSMIPHKIVELAVAGSLALLLCHVQQQLVGQVLGTGIHPRHSWQQITHFCTLTPKEDSLALITKAEDNWMTSLGRAVLPLCPLT